MTKPSILFLLAITAGPIPPSAAEPRDAEARTPVVDLAICLDTSGSMEGLIDAARQSIWAIVNDLASTRPSPRLRLALLTYGNQGHDAASGWVRVDLGLTEDLDAVSASLFALTTNGGEEYVGRVLRRALDDLDWSEDPDALRVAVVAGNEAADQDPAVDFRAVCREAIARGILVNAIYCGGAGDGVVPGWREVAALADGQFATIDQSHAANAAIATPFDVELSELGTALNETYVPFGARGREGAAQQWVQDRNAAGIDSAVAAQRAVVKATVNYCNAHWDLVDACRTKAVDLAEVDDEALPEAMRGMTPQQRRAHVAAKQARRDELQERIHALQSERRRWLSEERARRAAAGDRSFDHAVRRAIRAQAEAKGLRPPAAAPQAAPRQAGPGARRTDKL